MRKPIKIYITALLCLCHMAYCKNLPAKTVAALAVKQAIDLHLKGKKQDSKDFITYALARDKNNREAILFQAKVRKSMKVKGTLTAADHKALKAYFAYIGKTSKKENVKLLHYVLLSKLDPEHEETLIAIAMAENKSIDVSYSSVHETVFKKTKTVTNKVEPKSNTKKIKVRFKMDRVPYSASLLDRAIDHIDVHNVVKLKALLRDTPSLSKGGTSEGLLHLAARKGHDDILKLLLECGGNIDHLTSSSRNTPLHIAAYNGHLNAVKFLLLHGANKSLKNYYGSTPAAYAKSNGHNQVAQYIEDFKSN